MAYPSQGVKAVPAYRERFIRAVLDTTMGIPGSTCSVMARVQGRKAPHQCYVCLGSTRYPSNTGHMLWRGRKRRLLRLLYDRCLERDWPWEAKLLSSACPACVFTPCAGPDARRPATWQAHARRQSAAWEDHGGRGTHDGRTAPTPWWETPPAEYANARSTRWSDAAAIARGEQLFQTYCLMCHGADGKGTGPVAKGLPHPPADLTHHFHRAPGDGDAYPSGALARAGNSSRLNPASRPCRPIRPS